MSNDTMMEYPQMLNPGEPFVYLPPDLGRQLHYFQYVTSAITGMFAWELLRDLPNLYQFFVVNRPSLRAVAFHIAVFLHLLAIFDLYIALGICWAVGSAFTALLFLLRVWDLYRNNFMVVGFFAFAWLCVIGGAMTVPIAGRNQAASGHLLEHETFCITLGIAYPAYTGSSVIIPAIHDILIFIVVTYHLFPSYNVPEHITWRKWSTLFFTSNSLPRLYEAMVQNGQKYYLLAVAAHISILTTFFTPSVPAPYRVMSTLVLLSFVNSMACRVYCLSNSGHLSYGSSVTTRPTHSTSNTIPFHATPRNRDNTIVNVDVPKGFIGRRSGVPDDLAEIELPDRSFKSDVEMYSHV
ncbi:hypothetical protein PENSPDRAFT_680016 [Peniophora sp. CONT]|nr:hypothetical protein PENSPDRAFT_680016 [Peniophora sp. CONT]